MKYIKTTAANLIEYNKKVNGESIIGTMFVGFGRSETGVSERRYIDRIKGTATIVGSEYVILFNSDPEEANEPVREI